MKISKRDTTPKIRIRVALNEISFVDGRAKIGKTKGFTVLDATLEEVYEKLKKAVEAEK